MSPPMTDRPGLGIHQVEGSAASGYLHRGRQHSADDGGARRPTCHPLLVRAEAWESGAVVMDKQPIAWLETGPPRDPPGAARWSALPRRPRPADRVETAAPAAAPDEWSE